MEIKDHEHQTYCYYYFPPFPPPTLSDPDPDPFYNNDESSPSPTLKRLKFRSKIESLVANFAAQVRASHGLKPKSMQFFGNDVRFGFVPYDDNSVYWFFTWTPFSQDGLNLVVARWLGFKKPASIGKLSIRGSMDFNYSHGLKPKSMQFFGNDVRFGFVPYDDNSVYWFFTWTPFSQGELFT
ncbi:monooxygenase 2 [Quercus suber]|uniref:Monooxygenase 2 n=1 Tax=Quercus suber TaxID=58331 RepID=A0AAW0KMM2_QUESU